MKSSSDSMLVVAGVARSTDASFRFSPEDRSESSTTTIPVSSVSFSCWCLSSLRTFPELEVDEGERLEAAFFRESTATATATGADAVATPAPALARTLISVVVVVSLFAASAAFLFLVGKGVVNGTLSGVGAWFWR